MHIGFAHTSSLWKIHWVQGNNIRTPKRIRLIVELGTLPLLVYQYINIETK